VMRAVGVVAVSALSRRSGRGAGTELTNQTRCCRPIDAATAIARLICGWRANAWGARRRPRVSDRYLSKSLCDLFGGLTHDVAERGDELGDHALS
jgi:hypothetical protein